MSDQPSIDDALDLILSCLTPLATSRSPNGRLHLPDDTQLAAARRNVEKMAARIAELEAKATADRKYMDEAETRIAEREAELKHLHSRWAWTEYWFDNLYPAGWERCQAKYEHTKIGAQPVDQKPHEGGEGR